MKAWVTQPGQSSDMTNRAYGPPRDAGHQGKSLVGEVGILGPAAVALSAPERGLCGDDEARGTHRQKCRRSAHAPEALGATAFTKATHTAKKVIGHEPHRDQDGEDHFSATISFGLVVVANLVGITGL